MLEKNPPPRPPPYPPRIRHRHSRGPAPCRVVAFPFRPFAPDNRNWPNGRTARPAPQDQEDTDNPSRIIERYPWLTDLPGVSGLPGGRRPPEPWRAFSDSRVLNDRSIISTPRQAAVIVLCLESLDERIADGVSLLDWAANQCNVRGSIRARSRGRFSRSRCRCLHRGFRLSRLTAKSRSLSFARRRRLSSSPGIASIVSMTTGILVARSSRSSSLSSFLTTWD